MTVRKRRWWMLHWPSWVALTVFGGAFLVGNLFTFPSPDTLVGWPLPWAALEMGSAPEGPWFVASPTLPDWDVKQLIIWGLLVDPLVALLTTAAAIIPIERTCRWLSPLPPLTTKRFWLSVLAVWVATLLIWIFPPFVLHELGAVRPPSTFLVAMHCSTALMLCATALALGGIAMLSRRKAKGV